MATLDVSFSLLIEAQGLIKVNLSDILDQFVSNQFMLCPWAMSFFQKLCPDPFPPVTVLHFKSISSLVLNLHGPTLTFIHDFDYTDLCKQSNVSAF